MKILQFITIFVLFVSSITPTTSSAQQTATPAKQPTDIASFVAATTGLAESGNATLLTLRTIQRMELVRASLNDGLRKILPKSAPDKNDRLIDFKQLAEFLCDSRKNYFELKGSVETLRSISGSLSTIYRDDSDKNTWGRLVEYIFHNPGTIPSPVPREYKDVCHDDLTKFQDTFFAIQNSRANKAVISVIPQIDEIAKILEPAVKIFLDLATEHRRRQALFNFFKETKNKEAILNAAKNTRLRMRTANDTTRSAALAIALEQWSILSETIVDLSKLDACKDLVGKPIVTEHLGLKVDPKYLSCYAAVWSQLEKQIESSLLKSATYDADADIAVQLRASEATAVAGITTSMEKFGRWEVPTTVALQQLQQIFSLAREIENVLKPENQKKLKEAIAGLMGKS
jgi:hypothetical protein